VDTADATYLQPDAGPDVAVDAQEGDSSLFDGVPGNCAEQIQSNGYAFGTVPACSACNASGSSRESGCKTMIDCLASHWPCEGNCWNECLNTAGDAVVGACATALTNAACQ
jgi:hypothetical protein